MKRYCKFCGKDISNEKFDRITCYSKECLAKQDSYVRKNKKQKNFCIICGKDISARSSKAKICESVDCVKEYRRIFYASRKKQKKCKDCGDLFFGTGKKTYCDNCSLKRKKNKKIGTIKQKIACKKCGEIIAIVEKKRTRPVEILFNKICDKCKKKTKQEMSNRMKKINPSFKEGQTSKKKHTVLTKEEFSKIMSDRMKKNNPMKNLDCVERVRNTIKSKIKSGEMVYKKGCESKRWKGNRKFNKHCRISLRKWVFNEFEKVGFVCQKCGKKGGELHVHHTEALRTIIDCFLKKFNTTSVKIMDDNEKLNKITNEIIKYHYENNVGVVVCKTCHGLIDEYYNQKK